MTIIVDWGVTPQKNTQKAWSDRVDAQAEQSEFGAQVLVGFVMLWLKFYDMYKWPWIMMMMMMIVLRKCFCILCDVLILSSSFWLLMKQMVYLVKMRWTASSEFGTYRLCKQRRFRRACTSAQSRQNLRCSLIQAVSHEEPSDRKPDPWPLWMAGHAQLKFVMTECSKTEIRLTGLKWCTWLKWDNECERINNGLVHGLFQSVPKSLLLRINKTC